MSEEKLEDGNYRIEAVLQGGSGRATIQSPARVTVENHSPVVRIQWNSLHYDYMKLEGVTYYPLEGEEYPVFLLPFDPAAETMEVIADTTAMSVPHEINYRIEFDPSSLQREHSYPPLFSVGLGLLICAAVGYGMIQYNKRKRKKYDSC